MGLEIVELGIRVEEEFGVTIEDADYERLKTVQDLQRYVEWKLGAIASNGWPTYDTALVRAFCRLRREIVRQTGIPRTRLRPSTRLAEHWHSRDEWNLRSRSLSEVLELPIRSWFAEGWMIGGCLGILVAPLLAMPLMLWDLPVATCLSLILLFCFGLGAVLSIRGAEHRFHIASLGDITRDACYAFAQQEASDPPAVSFSRRRSGPVLPRLLALISEVASLPVDEIKPESRFIEDLMMG